jgi:hypothetical protein
MVNLQLIQDPQTVGEQAGKWWNWYLGTQDPDNNPIVNNVLFLNGWPHNTAPINITNKTSVFFPVIDSMYILDKKFADKDLNDNVLDSDQKIQQAISQEKTNCKFAYIIHPPDTNNPIDPLQWTKVEYQRFNLGVRKDCKFRYTLENRLPEGRFEARLGGYYVYIKSLDSSNKPYRIRFGAEGERNYNTNGTYDITVR